MFQPLRRSGYGQTVFALAALLAISSAFGMHPEPTSARPLPSVDSSPLWTPVDVSDQVSHGCLACLAHRSVSLPRLCGAVLEPGASVTTAVARPTPQPADIKTAPHQGRAPPAHC